MEQTLTQVEISRSIDDVFAFLSNLDNSHLWTVGLVEVRHEGPLRLGASGIDVRTMGKKAIEMPWTVVAFDPPRRAAFEYSLPFPLTADFVLEKIEGGTRVTCETTMKPTGLWKFMSPFMAREARKTDKAQFEKAKQILESRGTMSSSDIGATDTSP